MIRRQCQNTLTSVVVLFCLVTTGFCEEPIDSELQQKIDHLSSELLRREKIPGLSIAIATENQLRYEKGFGLADVENEVPVTNLSRFRTASIAKPLTAVTILSLAEEGAIDLDAEVQNYCPEYPKKQWPITVRQLLGHLGGVRHYQEERETRTTEHYFSLRSALNTFADDPLLHEPGSRFHYTTFGYNLLGSVAEGAAKRTFMDALNDRVVKPAGMTSTVVDDSFSIVPGRVAGYLRPSKSMLSRLPADHNLKEGELYNAASHDTSMKIPGGGLLSTPGDLIRFACAVNCGELLTDETRRSMWTSQTTADGKETGYGLGWRVGKRGARKVVSHTGGQAGTSTVLLLVPETGTAVAIMCNLQNVNLTGAATAIADLVDPTPTKAESVTDYTSAIEKLTRAIRYEVEQKQLPALSIALVDGDRTVWAEGFGFQDVNKKVPATAVTVYRVGSISKLFTDIAVMQLVEQEKVELDLPVTQYVPEFTPRSPYETPITLRQLMAHRSGLVRESPVGNYFDPTEPSLDATVASLNDTALVYPPNTKTKYSNAAVSVVGAVLESKLDVSHPEQVRQTILDPLEMENSSFVVSENVAPKRAAGWMRTYDGRRFQAPEFLLGTGPAGNMYASMTDLAKFLKCLFREGKTTEGQILKPAALAAMYEPIGEAESKSGFGLGFHVQPFEGYKKIGHGGAVYGFSTQLEALPERKIGVAASASLDGTNGVVGRLVDYALRLMLAAQDGKPLPDYVMTSPIPADRAKELVGQYRELDSEAFVEISELNGDVFLRRDPYRHDLRSHADDGSIVVDDEIGFGMKVELLDNNRLQVGDKVFNRLPAKVPSEIPERWKGLIGEYGWDHNTLYILEDHGQLYALIEWFYYYPLKEVDENVFEFPDYGLYHGEGLTFSRDAAGVATQVNAAEIVFERREVGTKDGETFKIAPLRPIDELRNGALAATPPLEKGEFRDAELVEIVSLDSSILLDIRYATTNNFMGAVFYKQPRAFLQRPAAEAAARVHERLKDQGLGLLIHDAYRPWFVTKMFWDATPDSMKDFVANPANGSRHNRGCAVDLTLFDLESRTPIQMVAGYDEFSPRSFPLYPGGTSRQRWYRDQLRRAMEAEGFTVYEYEWWHFDYRDWKKYRIGNVTFEEIEGVATTP